MRIVIVGNRKLARYLLQHLQDEDRNVVGALVAEGELAAEQANFAPFDKVVENTDCELHRTSDINSQSTVEWLNRTNPDVCICGGWSQIIKPKILNVPEKGFFGLHSSRLPKGRGGAPVNWSLINGAEEVWISMFYYETEVDAGDVVEQRSTPVEARDDIKTVFASLSTEACQLVSSVLSDLEQGTLNKQPQSVKDASYRPRRQPQDGLINWNHDVEVVNNWVRSQTRPYPGAYTFYGGNKLTVWRGKPVSTSSDGAASGEVIRIADGRGVDVQAGKGTYRLTRVQSGENPPQWADRFAHENDLSLGDRLGHHSAPKGWLYTGLKGLLEPKSFDTNLKTSETGTITVALLSVAQNDFTVQVFLDDEEIFSDSATMECEYLKDVEFSPPEPGVYTLSVEFKVGNKLVDSRYLKVFVHD